jgi:hypothetical protein
MVYDRPQASPLPKKAKKRNGIIRKTEGANEFIRILHD